MFLAIAGDELPDGSSITDLVELAQRYDFKYVELMHPKNTQAAGVPKSLEILKQAEIEIICVCSPSHMFVGQNVEAQQTTLMESIDIAASSGAKFANTYFGNGPIRDDEAAIETYAENLQPCLRRASELGVTIVLENEFDFGGHDVAQSDITRRPESIRRLVERIDSPNFRLTLDACNFYFAGVEAYPYTYNLLRDYIAYVQVKDGARYHAAAYPALSSPGVVTDHSGEYLCLPVGQGAVNYGGLLDSLRADGYTGPLTMEPETEVGRWDDTCRQTIDYLRGWGASMRE